MATGPKKLVSFLLNYFVFKKLLPKTSYDFSNSETDLLIQR